MDQTELNATESTTSSHRGRDRTVKPAFQALLLQAQSSNLESNSISNNDNTESYINSTTNDDNMQTDKQTNKNSIKLNPFNPHSDTEDDELSYVEKGRPALISRHKLSQIRFHKKKLKNNAKLRKRSASRTNRILKNWRRIKTT